MVRAIKDGVEDIPLCEIDPFAGGALSEGCGLLPERRYIAFYELRRDGQILAAEERTLTID